MKRGGEGVTNTPVSVYMYVYVSNVYTEGVRGLAEMFLGWLLIEVMKHSWVNLLGEILQF